MPCFYQLNENSVIFQDVQETERYNRKNVVHCGLNQMVLPNYMRNGILGFEKGKQCSLWIKVPRKYISYLSLEGDSWWFGHPQCSSGQKSCRKDFWLWIGPANVRVLAVHEETTGETILLKKMSFWNSKRIDQNFRILNFSITVQGTIALALDGDRVSARYVILHRVRCLVVRSNDLGNYDFGWDSVPGINMEPSIHFNITRWLPNVKTKIRPFGIVRTHSKLKNPLEKQMKPFQIWHDA